MKKVFDKDSEERKFFGELWELCQKYWIPEENLEYWGDVVRDTDALNEKYKYVHPAVTHMISGFINGIEVKSKEIRNNGK